MRMVCKSQKNKKGTLLDAVQFPAGCWSQAEHLRLFNYTRSTLPDLRALADTQTRLGLPSTRIRTF